MKIISHSVKDTFNLAKKMAAELHGGEVLCLIGDLGAGKTAFTKGLAAGLGVTNTITSPSFVLMKVYPVTFSSPLRKGRLGGVECLAHIDAYRLSDGGQLADIGVLDYFKDSNCITVIEWADRVYPVKLLDKYVKLKCNMEKFVKNLKPDELGVFNRVKDIWPKQVIKIEFKILKGDKREIKIVS